MLFDNAHVNIEQYWYKKTILWPTCKGGMNTTCAKRKGENEISFVEDRERTSCKNLVVTCNEWECSQSNAPQMSKGSNNQFFVKSGNVPYKS